MGHSLKECPFNLKTRTSQQVFLTQEAEATIQKAPPREDIEIIVVVKTTIAATTIIPGGVAYSMMRMGDQ